MNSRFVTKSAFSEDFGRYHFVLFRTVFDSIEMFFRFYRYRRTLLPLSTYQLYV